MTPPEFQEPMTPEQEENHIMVYQFGYEPEYRKHHDSPQSTASDFAHRAALKAVAQAAIATDSTRAELVRVLTICRDKFFEYAQIHRDKMTDEGQRKAVANRELGLMCKDALAAAGASCYDEGCPRYGTAHGHTEPGTVEGTLKALEILTAGNPPDFTEPTREKCTNPDCRIG